MHNAPVAQLETLSQDEDPDASLVRAAQRDPRAFAALYRRYVTPIYRYVYNRVGDTASAEDVTAQVFADALEALPRYRERGRFAAWLFTIARRRCADHHRSAEAALALDEAMDSPTGDTGPLAEVIQAESLRHLNALLTRLSEEQREMLRLRYAVGLTYREIGTIVGRSEAAVKMAMHRLLRRLGAAWEETRE